MYKFSTIILLLTIVFASCRDARIHEENRWGTHFSDNGVENGCFIMRDNNHEAVHYYNKDRCIERYSPLQTFDIFTSLVALDIPKVPDEQFVILWDSVDRGDDNLNKDMGMREAFQLGNNGYFEQLAVRVGYDYLQHYVDTANYGNKEVKGAVDSFWMNGSIQISADEQLGFIKRLYFNELPFSERTQRIVRSLLLQEDTDDYKLYYKTGHSLRDGKQFAWIVGYVEKIIEVEEHEEAMNKSDIRMYPYFFAQNIELEPGVTNSKEVSLKILKSILADYGSIPKTAKN